MDLSNAAYLTPCSGFFKLQFVQYSFQSRMNRANHVRTAANQDGYLCHQWG